LRFFDVEEEEEGIGAFVMFGGFCCVGWFVVGWKEAAPQRTRKKLWKKFLA
jgi:hypothetical protein